MAVCVSLITRICAEKIVTGLSGCMAICDVKKCCFIGDVKHEHLVEAVMNH